MRSTTTLSWFGLGLWAVAILFNLAITVGLIYAMYHFISKFW